jgi:hypothetical protein
MHMRHNGYGAASWGALARGGVVGGLAGGIVMAMITMVGAAVHGMGFLRPLYLIAATFHRPWATAQGVQIGPLLIGLMDHMVNSAIFGLILALGLGAVTREHGLGTMGWVLAGMIWGVVLLVANQYVILHTVDPAMETGMREILAWWVASHPMYGLVLGAIIASPLGVGATMRSTSRQPA